MWCERIFLASLFYFLEKGKEMQLDRETRELIKREISRKVLESLPRDEKGRIIPEKGVRIYNSAPGSWMPYLSGKRR